MPVRNISCSVAAVLATPAPNHFPTKPVAALNLDLQGIPGDRHYGFTRAAGAREPWYARGETIRSGRQISIVSLENLAEIARRLEIPHLEPGWLGANVVITHVPEFTLLPIGTRIIQAAGAVLVNEGENLPCRLAGAEIARHYPNRPGLDRLFPKAAIALRGIVATVERAGPIAPGPATLKIPEQRIWTGGSLL